MTIPPKLSRQERQILVYLYELYVPLKERQGRPGVLLGCRTADTFGVPWRTSGTRSEQASVSRSLRRLEARGLILRQNISSGSGEGTGTCRWSKAERHNRSTHVRPLPEGIAAAKRLTVDASELLTVCGRNPCPGLLADRVAGGNKATASEEGNTHGLARRKPQ